MMMRGVKSASSTTKGGSRGVQVGQHSSERSRSSLSSSEEGEEARESSEKAGEGGVLEREREEIDDDEAVREGMRIG